MKKKYLLYSILLANMAALPAGAALSASADNVPTHDNVPGVDQKSIRDSLAYEAYLDSISRQFDLTEVVVTGTRTPKFLKDTPIQTRVIGSKDIARLDAGSASAGVAGRGVLLCHESADPSQLFRIRRSGSSLSGRWRATGWRDNG